MSKIISLQVEEDQQSIADQFSNWKVPRCQGVCNLILQSSYAKENLGKLTFLLMKLVKDMYSTFDISKIRKDILKLGCY